MRFRLGQLGSGLWALVRHPIDPAWTITVVAATAALLLSGIGLLIGELAEVSEPDPVVVAEPSRPKVHLAKIAQDGRAWRLEIRGDPGARVALTQPGGASQVITLDKAGNGTAGLSSPDANTIRVEVQTLTEEPDLIAERVVVIPPTPRPVPTLRPTPQPSARRPTPQPQRQASVAPSPTPTIAPRATATPQPTIPPIRVVTTKHTPRKHDREQTPAPEPKRHDVSATTPRETSGPTPPVLHLVIDAGPRIAMTFDGGASSNHTADLLDLLRELGLQSTLFLTGQFIEKQPALVRRALLEGHEIGNHTYSHPHLTTWEKNRRHQTLPGMSRARLQNELRRTEKAFHKATGRPMVPLWRAPFGEENAALRRWAYEIGYLHVRWSSLEGRSLDTLDWISDEHSALYRDSKRIMNNLLAFPRLEGGIVLMHLATDREVPPWEHLPEFVAALTQRGISQVKITTLLEESRIWDSWLHGATERHAQQAEQQ